MVPWVLPPEEVVPGVPLFYATAMPFNGYGNGLLVESHMGRPTKAEGNPLHPASLGATDVFGQASVLTLYDPDCSQVITRQGRVQGWYGFVAALRDAASSLSHGSGLRILTETITSPTLADQIQRLLKRYPEAKWHQYQPVNRDNVRAGAKLAFGQIVNSIYRFDKADVILSLDADFLFALPGSLAFARQFAARRDPLTWGQSMSRLYAVETMPSITGATADHRLPVRPGEMEGFAGAMRSVKLRVHLGLYKDETGAVCDWHIPESHFLEAWGDVRACDGTATIIQPLIAPLFDSNSAYQVLSALLGNADENTYDVLRAYWKGRNLSPNFEKFWQTSVHDGVIAGTALRPLGARASRPLPVEAGGGAGGTPALPFFRYADWQTPTPAMQKNPDVTVRSRGVMEKCTYCIQRVQEAKIEAVKQDRRVRDGEIRTACQQACPTEAIIFGDLNDPKSRVAKLKAQPRDYGMLAELNTRPRTTYLGRITNSNPEIERE